MKITRLTSPKNTISTQDSMKEYCKILKVEFNKAIPFTIKADHSQDSLKDGSDVFPSAHICYQTNKHKK